MPSARLTLLLASASPARRTTLIAAGVTPHVRVSSVDEDAAVAAAEAMSGPLEAPDVALLLARAKAEDVVSTIEADETGDTDGADETDDLPDDLLVLGCDSVLELDGEVHGKPADAAEAVERWRRMRGRTAPSTPGTGSSTLRHPDDGGTGGMVGGTASTTVHFADLDDDEIDRVRRDRRDPLKVAGRVHHRRDRAGRTSPRSRATRAPSSGSPCRCCASSCASWGCPGTTCAPRPPDRDRPRAQTGGTSRRLSVKCRSRRAA
jgi:septum formation protein